MKSAPELAVTVILATHAGELLSNLREALDSIVAQTLPPSLLVVVFDGPVPQEQVQLVSQIVLEAPFRIDVVQLPENVGRGEARNRGIARAPDSYIALMDSDDVCVPTRLEKQVEFLRKCPDVDVVAGWTEEFFSAEQERQPIVKYCPTSHKDIVAALKWTNCVANPTLMFGKRVWQSAGGFGDFRNINEDYLFYLRAIRCGAVFACIPEVLLRVRITSDQRHRRKGMKVLSSDLRFRYTAWKEGHVGLGTNLVATTMIVFRRLAPRQVDLILHRVWRRFAKFLYARHR